MALTRVDEALVNKGIVTKTTTYTAKLTDNLILASGSAFTITLPAASTAAGKILEIMKTDSSFSNIITIDGNASETINGSLTTTLNTQYESVKIACDGSNWFILHRRIPSEATVYTMTIGGATSAPTKASSPAYDLATWQRIGSHCRIRYSYRHTSNTGAAAGSGIYLFPLPSGLTIDTTKVAANNDNLAALGPFGGVDSTNGSLLGAAVYYNTTNVSLTGVNATAITNTIGSGTYCALTLATCSINFVADVPISGWNG